MEKDEYSVMTGSQSNFAGDVYDSLIAVRKGNILGEHKIVENPDGKSWKKFLMGIKKKYRLSWAGRATFTQMDGKWWLVFHGVDKDIRPDGSYGGVIPADTEKYHRNIYAVPVDFYINLKGEVDMKVLM